MNDRAWPSRRDITVALDGPEAGLCATSARLLDVSGAAITVVAEGGHRGLMCASNGPAAAIEDLQVTLGEGPGIDAHRLGVPVTDSDLAALRPSRWVAFCGPAVEAGAAAVFAFPLRIGGVRLGTLTFNHHHAGRLADDRYATAIAIVDVVTRSLLATQAGASPGTLALSLEAVVDDGAEIHQAAGMLAVRLDVRVGEALVRLRALAYAGGRSAADLARDVVRGGDDIS